VNSRRLITLRILYGEKMRCEKVLIPSLAAAAYVKLAAYVNLDRGVSSRVV